MNETKQKNRAPRSARKTVAKAVRETKEERQLRQFAEVKRVEEALGDVAATELADLRIKLGDLLTLLHGFNCNGRAGDARDGFGRPYSRNVLVAVHGVLAGIMKSVDWSGLDGEDV